MATVLQLFEQKQQSAQIQHMLAGIQTRDRRSPLIRMQARQPPALVFDQRETRI